MEPIQRNKLKNTSYSKVTLRDKSFELPAFSPHLDKATNLEMFADTNKFKQDKINLDAVATITLNFRDMKENIRLIENNSSILKKTIGSKFFVNDTNSELTYYYCPKDRELLTKLNLHPSFNKLLKYATPQNHGVVWNDHFGESNESDRIKFVENTLAEQNLFENVAFPITPLIEKQSTKKVIDLAIDINREACSQSKLILKKDFLGINLTLHANLFDSDLTARSRLSELSAGLTGILQEFDKTFIFMKIVGFDDIQTNRLERLNNIMSFVSGFHLLKQSESINEHDFILNVAGLNKTGIALLGKGADISSELLNGKTSVQLFAGTKNRPADTEFMFGNYYHPYEHVHVTHASIIDFWKKNKALPCSEYVCSNTADPSVYNHLTWARFVRLHFVEAKNKEVKELRADLKSGEENGLRDRLARSQDKLIQEIAKIF